MMIELACVVFSNKGIWSIQFFYEYRLQQFVRMIASIDQLIFEIQEKREIVGTSTPKRSRWTRKDEALFEQLAVRFGSDYKLLGSFLPHKTERQLRKRYRYLCRYCRERLEKMEKEIITSRRKNFFDQHYLQDTDSSCSQEVNSSSPDLSPQSLQ